MLAAACATAVAVAATTNSTSGAGLALPSTNQQRLPQNGNGYGFFPFPNESQGNGQSNGQSSGQGGTSAAGTATRAQSVGVVDITTVLDFGAAKAAGTGMVVTAGGEILTNNHVVQDATSIQVTVVSTGATYTATVVGTDPSDDVAVLQLSNAGNLATAAFGDSNGVKVGDAVTGVGNAGGVGGTPSSASGHVTALDQTITASDGGGQNAETVSGLIESDAPIQAGDSGGPLYNAAGRIVGMDTAAESGRSGATLAAYSIPIDKALSIAQQIESGDASSTIHIGYPGFLGVNVEDATGGALVTGVVTGYPAAKAGLVAGDVITAVDGTAVSSSEGLHNAMQSRKPNSTVRLTWTDRSGASHSATLTLVAGPAD
jgi:S1-C subfamily serine protease